MSAVINGESVYSEEVVWFPKTQSDPAYHFDGIVSAMKTAASKMPRVDAIGVSSAGVYINNHTMSASLFLKVGAEDYEKYVKDIYIRAAKEIGDVPLTVCNDGDVTALAGAMSLGEDGILGIAMGTSEAGGYVDMKGNITGWLNELAFVPCDLAPDAMVDEWSGDVGCGVKYFSQDAVIKLAPAAGIELDPALSPAEKLKVVQGKMEQGDAGARAIYETIGVYLGYTLAFYAMFYEIKPRAAHGPRHSGEGGDPGAGQGAGGAPRRIPAAQDAGQPARRKEPAPWARAWPPRACPRSVDHGLPRPRPCQRPGFLACARLCAGGQDGIIATAWQCRQQIISILRPQDAPVCPA